MNISTRIIGLTGGIVLLIIVGGTFALFAFRQQQKEARLLVEESMNICRSIMDINRYHHDHNLLFTQTVGVGEREVIEMEGLEEFNQSVDVFRATCMEFDQKVFASLSNLDSLSAADALPEEFVSNFAKIRDRLLLLHEEHEVCMPHTQAVFDLIELGDVASAKERAKIVWEDEVQMKKGIEGLIAQQVEFNRSSLAASDARQNKIAL